MKQPIDLQGLYGDRLADLTERQREVIQFIVVRAAAHGTTPTFREIGKALRIKNANGVRCHLTSLAKKGFLHPLEGKRIALKGLRFVPVREGV